MPPVEDETGDHLYAAEQNRALALVLVGTDAAQVRPRRTEWAGIVAFYASVHYVNAYLWEARRFAPASHRERSQAVVAESALRPIRDNYRLLRLFAYDARYAVPFTANEDEVRDLIDVDLRAVEAAVHRALGLPTPMWHLPDPI